MTAMLSVMPETTVASERTELILAQLDKLPTLPAVATKVLSLTTSTESSAREVVNLLSSDAALASGVLSLAQRADRGVRHQKLTLGKAVTLLGFDAVRNHVLAVAVYQALPGLRDDERSWAARRGMWLHNLAVAFAAEELARRVEPKLASDAFVCGLLHDIGKIALDACLPKSYARVLERVEREHICICEAERGLFGLDHMLAGKRVVQRWKLPPAVMECVWLHHVSKDALPSTVRHERLLHIVRLADHLVRRHGIGFSGFADVDTTVALMGPLRLNGSTTTEVIELLPTRVEPLAELLGLRPGGEALLTREALLHANRQLSDINANLMQAQRTLSGRARCLDIITTFHEQLNDVDRLTEVCGRAAERVMALFSAERAVAFFGEPGGPCLYTAAVERHAGSRPACVVDLAEIGEAEALLADLLAGRYQGLVRAPQVTAFVWELNGRPCPDGLWMLAVPCGDGLAGAVLFVPDASMLTEVQEDRSLVAAIGGAIGAAASSVQARSRAERMGEELLAVNRRLRSAQQTLVRARSIAMIAEMAAGAAHELNNPLSVIAGRSQMLLSSAKDAESRRALEIINEQAQRASQIVTDLMGFAKPPPPLPVEQSLGAVLEAACQPWREREATGAPDLRVCEIDAGAMVYADPEQLRQIIDAVLINAVEAAGPEKARIEVNSPSTGSDETVRIVIRDQGPGMRREVLEHALDPFFSSRPAGRGRGLGLSRAYRLAEINGGCLWLDSTPEVGTTVTIELPARADVGREG